MKLTDILKQLETWAPPSLQEGYDNARLITGDPRMEITSALATLDCTEKVVDEAIQRNCNLIIAHHPIVFGSLKSLTGKNYVERTVIKAIKNDIAIYAIHTNLDNVSSGVNAKIGERLQLKNLEILAPKSETLSKLFTFAPLDHADAVRQALFEAGAGNIGDYDHCSFNQNGTGTFRGSDSTNPFVGEKGEEHHEDETKIEVVFPRHLQSQVIQALIKSHPYEEVAYDVIHLANVHPGIGSGMTGELEPEMNEEDFLRHVAKCMNIKVIKHTSFRNKSVRKVAFCGGAGSFLLNKAKSSKADVFITGDFKYHEFFDADNAILVLDIGHFESEQFTPELIKDFLDEKFPTFAVLLSEVNTNPVHYFTA